RLSSLGSQRGEFCHLIPQKPAFGCSRQRQCVACRWPPTEGAVGRAIATCRESSPHLVRFAFPNATNELARVDAQRPPDHEPTPVPVLPARTSQDVPGTRPQFSKCFYFADGNILTGEFAKSR